MSRVEKPENMTLINPPVGCVCLDDINQHLVECKSCPRLVAWREEVAITKRRAFIDEEYWGKPVPGFGDPEAAVLVVGLAPGAHGSNRTGRMFTGDASGDFLYPALYRAGFANQPYATHAGDGLTLKNLYITAICRCVPPGNKPNAEEIGSCLHWLEEEISCLKNLRGIVLLGRIALEGVLRLPSYAQFPKKAITFAHGAFFQPDKTLPWLLCSYHPSRQNTQTKRLTTEMFDAIWQQVTDKLADSA